MKITDVKPYRCGYCVNQLQRVFWDAPRRKQKFPAIAVFFRHNGDAYLFDTGYARRVLACGWQSVAYKTLNPVVVDDTDALAVQLAKDGISTAEIKGIILSHLHPDHIGGLLDFPESQVYISGRTQAVLQKPSLLDLVFPALLPGDFAARCKCLPVQSGYDIFGDGSALLEDISGHTDGQLGLHLPEHNLFLAADSSWGADWLGKPMKLPGRILQRDYGAYQTTADKVKRMQNAGVQVLFSHEEI